MKAFNCYYVFMRTTFDLPDELMRAVKIRAVHEGRKLKDMVALLLRRGLGKATEDRDETGTRVRLPLVHCAHAARSEGALTPERVAQALIEDETD